MSAVRRRSPKGDPGDGEQAGARKARPAGPPKPLGARVREWLLGWPGAGVLLAAQFGLAVSSVVAKSSTYDEAAALVSGYSYWLLDDYRLNPEAGNLPQRIVSFPLVIGLYQFPSTGHPYFQRPSAVVLGYDLFYDCGNDFREMLFVGRAMIALVGVVLAATVWRISRSLFGPAGGMVSLLLAVASPSLLAHGRLATTDLTVSLFFTVSAWALWQCLGRLTWPRVAGSALAMGAVFLSKMSGVLIVPMAAALVLIRLATPGPIPTGFARRPYIRGLHLKAAALLGITAVHVLVVIAMIWLFHGLRYSAFGVPPTMGGGPVAASPEPARFDISWEEVLAADAPGLGVVAFCRDHKLLPEAYLYGLARISQGSRGRLAFLNGRYSVTGWRVFFAYCFLVKTPLGVLAILLMALAAAVAGAFRGEGRADPVKAMVLGAVRTAPMWAVLAVYGLAAVASKTNIGHRYILPVYPPLFVLAGACLSWPPKRFWIPLSAACALAASAACASLAVWPHYLAFFNSLAGGPANGYKHLVDSSLDWGQDLPGLAGYLEARRLDVRQDAPVYLSYFGTADPRHHHIRAIQLYGHLRWQRAEERTFRELGGGVYCISATMLQGVCLGGLARAPWDDDSEEAYVQRRAEQLQAASDPGLRQRIAAEKGPLYLPQRLLEFERLQVGRLAAYLRRREPDDQVGYSILIYRLSDEEAKRAMTAAVVGQ